MVRRRRDPEEREPVSKIRAQQARGDTGRHTDSDRDLPPADGDRNLLADASARSGTDRDYDLNSYGDSDGVPNADRHRDADGNIDADNATPSANNRY